MQTLTDFLSAQATSQGKDLILLSGKNDGSYRRWQIFSAFLNEDQIDALSGGSAIIVELDSAPTQLTSPTALKEFMVAEEARLLTMHYQLFKADGLVDGWRVTGQD